MFKTKIAALVIFSSALILLLFDIPISELFTLIGSLWVLRGNLLGYVLPLFILGVVLAVILHKTAKLKTPVRALAVVSVMLVVIALLTRPEVSSLSFSASNATGVTMTKLSNAIEDIGKINGVPITVPARGTFAYNSGKTGCVVDNGPKAGLVRRDIGAERIYDSFLSTSATFLVWPYRPLSGMSCVETAVEYARLDKFNYR